MSGRVRWLLVLATVAVLTSAAGAVRSASVSRDELVPGRAHAPESTGTALVDPEPTPEPPPRRLFMPLISHAYDPLAPGPLLPNAAGFLAKLSPTGRQACAPATHLLLSQREGSPDAKPVALLYRASSDPSTNLDFYLGRRVRTSGPVSLSPAACRHLTWQLMAVARIEELETPPGGLTR